MAQIKDIENAIKKLPKKDLRQFRHWFRAYDAKEWDAQIETDAASGKFDALADSAIREYSQGKCEEF